jgi:SAM-dependent methyltransferase
MNYDPNLADNVWSHEARKNAREIIITGTGNNPELYEKSALENIGMMRNWGLLRPGLVTLHIGCGNGRIEKHLANEVDYCYGVDVSTEMIKLAEERCKGLENVGFFKCSGYNLDMIDDASIDLAYSFFVFQHIPRICAGSYMKELHRVLKPDGAFVCQFQLLGDYAIKSREYIEPPADHPSNIRLYSIGDIENLANDNGFKVVDYKERIQAELDSKRRTWDCNIYPVFSKA